eukprot:873019-Rhodomonas_salina.1
MRVGRACGRESRTPLYQPAGREDGEGPQRQRELLCLCVCVSVCLCVCVSLAPALPPPHHSGLRSHDRAAAVSPKPPFLLNPHSPRAPLSPPPCKTPSPPTRKPPFLSRKPLSLSRTAPLLTCVVRRGAAGGASMGAVWASGQDDQDGQEAGGGAPPFPEAAAPFMAAGVRYMEAALT